MKQVALILILFSVFSGSSLVVKPQSQDKTANTQSGAGQGISGNWEGQLNVGPQKLRLVLKVSQAADGALKATLDSLDQDSLDLKVDSITFDGRTLHFEMKDLLAVYDGTASSDGLEFTGVFAQGGTNFPLILRKAGAAPSTVTAQRGKVQMRLATIRA